MKKLVSFIVILSLVLTFCFPAAQAGTLSKTVQTVSTKVQYITAGEFVTSLLLGAKVKPNGIADYWGKALQLGLIPGEVKKDKPLTKAQASYIVWKLINAVPELKNKNIPVSVRRVPPTEAFMRGICFFGGPLASEYNIFNTQIVGYDLTDFIQGYQLLVMEYKYADGSTQIKYVWDRYKGVSLAPGTYKYIDDPFRKILAEFKKKYPDKVVYAPRPYQKGWMFTIDPLVEAKKLKYPIYNVPWTFVDIKTKKVVTHRVDIDTPERAVELLIDGRNAYEKLGIPLTRFDLAAITYLYHTQGREVFQGGIANYNIKEHPYFNMYFEDYLVNYPRKYPTDHTRFAYYCKDYYKIPQLYREPMLRLADLGIITPDQSALYIGVYYFNAGKTLTRAEAVQMIARVFDKTKRDVLDEFNSKVWQYWAIKNEVGLGHYIYYDEFAKKFVTSQNKYSFDSLGDGVIFTSPQVIVRIEEPKVMSITRVNAKLYYKGYGGFGLGQMISSIGSYDLAGFGVGDRGCIVYDEVDSVKVDVFDNQKTQLIDYVPLAYKDELKKDLINYTPAKVKSMSKSGEVLKQYGDVYINYKAKPIHGRIMDYELYTVIPQYKLTDKNYYLILAAKPDSKYTQ